MEPQIRQESSNSVAGKKPPGPWSLPLLGHFFDVRRDVLGFFTACARRHGDVVALRFGPWPALLLSNPADVEYVLVKNAGNFIKHRLFWDEVSPIFGRGLLTSEGAEWLVQRRLLGPAFAGQQLTSYGSVMVRHAQRMLEGWRAGDVRDLTVDLSDLTLRTAAETLLGAKGEQEVADLCVATRVITDEIAARFYTFPLFGRMRYRQCVRPLDRIVGRMIRERRSGVKHTGDLLSMLAHAQDGNVQAMSDQQLRDQAVTLLLAGNETTALALSWACCLLGQHPAIDEGVARELEEVLDGRAATVQDLPRLGLIERVILEAMRLYPAAWIVGREAVRDCRIGDYAVPAGTTLCMSPWVIHRDPRHFDSPESFRPDRWSGDLGARLPRCAFLPFGGGPRICIGNRFAMMQAKLILATLLQRFRLEGQRDRPAVPQAAMSLRAKGGVWVRLSAR